MGKLTIQEVAKILVEKNGLSNKEANRFASEFFSVIQQHLQEDELVKVKGLGTFKIIEVEARESVNVRTGERFTIESHSKVTFTPDNTMKELVNKPFSQFETVVLNDGVEFNDIQEDSAEQSEESVTEPRTETVEEPLAKVAENPAPVVQPVVVPAAQPVAEPVAQPVAEPVAQPVAEPVAQPVAEPVAQPVAEPVVQPVVESVETPASSSDEKAIFDIEKVEHHYGRWLLVFLLVAAMTTIGAYLGYEFGRRQTQTLVSDTIVVKDTVFMAESTESAKVAEKAAEKETPAPAAEPLDEYAAKDDRVRLGAYRIVGTALEVTLMKGQTFRSICRAHLGPNMECYVEVYNNLPRNPQLKAGDKIKIPKLELKKAK